MQDRVALIIGGVRNICRGIVLSVAGRIGMG